MKTTTVLLLGAVVTTLTLTSLATEPLLSPRAAGNQIKRITNSADAQFTTVSYVETGSPLLSPRAAGNQIMVLTGVNDDYNPSLTCRNNMIASPRAVTECSSHTTMPGCVTVAPLK